MPVADTEVLFALSPKDHKHQRVLKLLKELTDLTVPDTATLEFQAVLRARGKSPSQVKIALLALHETLTSHKVKEAKTIALTMLALQCELEEKYGLSFFDSLIAASALTLDRQIVSDDESFDKVPALKRILISQLK